MAEQNVIKIGMYILAMARNVIIIREFHNYFVCCALINIKVF